MQALDPRFPRWSPDGVQAPNFVTHFHHAEGEHPVFMLVELEQLNLDVELLMSGAEMPVLDDSVLDEETIDFLLLLCLGLELDAQVLQSIRFLLQLGVVRLKYPVGLETLGESVDEPVMDPFCLDAAEGPQEPGSSPAALVVVLVVLALQWLLCCSLVFRSSFWRRLVSL